VDNLNVNKSMHPQSIQSTKKASFHLEKGRFRVNTSRYPSVPFKVYAKHLKLQLM
jgi:hypothetical protein